MREQSWVQLVLCDGKKYSLALSEEERSLGFDRWGMRSEDETKWVIILTNDGLTYRKYSTPFASKISQWDQVGL